MSTSESNTELDDIVWRPVPGYEGRYEVSKTGKVRSLDRYTKTDYYDRHGNHVARKFSRGRSLSGMAVGPSGHEQVELYCKNGEPKRFLIHRLVMAAFGSEPANATDIINHVDNDATNNHIDNLEWVQPFENQLHGLLHRMLEEHGENRVRRRLDTWIDALTS
ncbi:NUMOD4 domain-containing protein [Longibacter salinarum]